MYKIAVPILQRNFERADRERIVHELKRLDADRVFLCVDNYTLDQSKLDEYFEDVAANCKFLKDQGFEVGTWYGTFLLTGDSPFMNLHSLKGKRIDDFICPSDENFVRFAADYIRRVAKCGFDVIQFEDDFRYAYFASTPACLCPNHVRRINELTGESHTHEQIKEFILTGGKNKVRDAYLKANGDAFRHFAAEMRRAVDEVNPNIRIGYCSCMSNWDVDGTDAYELAKLLAGNTRPFVRLIGAPYWAADRAWGASELGDVIEFERMESAWTKHPDVEVWAEGDPHPRPRLNCPASYLEGFDTAIRASGCTDGIIKYGLDYFSNADYETGYADRHERNRPIYRAIDRLFGDKKSCGVRVYESMKKVSDMVMPTKVNTEVKIDYLFFSQAARAFSRSSIPTVYEGDGVCGVAFDENARNLPLDALKNGLILDLAAAEILTERGIDVGLIDIGKAIGNGEGPKPLRMEEHFLGDGNHISIFGATVYDVKVKDNAEILSDIATDAGRIPLSYRYENAQGNRFLVLNLNTRFDQSAMLRHYARSRQIADNVSWLSGKKLPAYTYGHPNMYLQTKEKDGSLAVGLWNLFADVAFEPIVELADTYREIEFVNCSGTLDGNRVYLSDIHAFEFAFFEVRK